VEELLCMNAIQPVEHGLAFDSLASNILSPRACKLIRRGGRKGIALHLLLDSSSPYRSRLTSLHSLVP
jgi:hypothetical protein